MSAPFVKHLLREDRQEGQQREAEEGRRRGEHDQRREAVVVAHVVQPDLQLLLHPARLGRRDVLHAQHHQRVDDDEERQRVEQEAGVHRLRLAVAPAAGTPTACSAEGERPEHARDVELDRVERDRVRQILLVDERRDQRLIGRAAERLRAAGDERQRQDVPDLQLKSAAVEKHQQRERGRGPHLHALRQRSACAGDRSGRRRRRR